MEIQVVSTEKIKPKSPTPHHPEPYKISLLDQIIPSVYFPAVLYFAPHPTLISERIHLLKNSLASTLTHFRPLAGTIKDAFTVDCSDKGLPFSVAEVKMQLKDFLQNPDMQMLNRLLPIQFSWKEGAGPGSNPCTIQLNCFKCGGMAISVMLAHQIGDITSVSAFLNHWAATARGCEEEAIRPDYAAASVFKQNPSLQKESYLFVPLQKLLKLGNLVTRRYLFDADAISSLQARSRGEEDEENRTRVEAVSAFIWKCFMEAVQENRACSRALAAGKSGGNQNEPPFLLTQAVNLRRRAEPPFPNHSFGNFLWLAATTCAKPPPETDLKELACRLKRATNKIDCEFMKRLESENGYLENLEDLSFPEEAAWFSLSSWAKIGLHDVDFGWGKPVWLSGFVSADSASLMPNSAVLVETTTGDGIEAWVILDEEFMTNFENNEELKIYACLNPRVHV